MSLSCTAWDCELHLNYRLFFAEQAWKHKMSSLFFFSFLLNYSISKKEHFWAFHLQEEACASFECGYVVKKKKKTLWHKPPNHAKHETEEGIILSWCGLEITFSSGPDYHLLIILLTAYSPLLKKEWLIDQLVVICWLRFITINLCYQ